jgi:RNA polymerase subunit RPABC4/transcription elongation factor Spt4
MATSSDDYAKTGGQFCPVCGSDELTGGSLSTNSGYVTQSVGCSNCSAEWTDLAILIGYQDLKEMFNA